MAVVGVPAALSGQWKGNTHMSELLGRACCGVGGAAAGRESSCGSRQCRACRSVDGAGEWQSVCCGVVRVVFLRWR